MFLGEFEYKIDEKGRVPVPPRFRGELKDGVVLSPGPEKCINAYSQAGWSKLADSLTKGTLVAIKMRRLNRALFATAFSIDLDRQGRIAIPNQLRDYAGIEDEVVFAGANTYLELWNKGLWQAERAASLEQAGQIIESMEQR